MSNNPLDDALGLTPMNVNQFDDRNLPVVVEEVDPDADDLDEVRSNLHDAVSLSQQAVQDMLDIARQSQHPKAYEVLNSMIKTFADISMGLVDLEMKKQRIRGAKPSVENQTVNNNLFVGSTAELQKMLDDMSNKEGE